MIPHEWFESAQARVAPHIKQTPLTVDEGRGLFLKWENRQVTGSFKPRGAINKVLSLEAWERQAGLVAASAGNHGQGVALAGRLTDASVEVFVPEGAVPAKLRAIRELGARVHLVSGGYSAAESAGRKYAADNKKTFISPYNDGQVIAGQGTLGLEILSQLERPVSNWIVPAGGGGLIAALGIVLRRLTPRPRLIAVQAEASPFTHSLFQRGTQDGIQDLPTLADGLSGEVEEGSVTIPIIRECVDDFLLVSEKQIEGAIAFAWTEYHERIEGSAAVGLAAILAGRVNGGSSLVVVTGGNIQPEVHQEIVERHRGESWN